MKKINECNHENTTELHYDMGRSRVSCLVSFVDNDWLIREGELHICLDCGVVMVKNSKVK